MSKLEKFQRAYEHATFAELFPDVAPVDVAAAIAAMQVAVYLVDKHGLYGHRAIAMVRDTVLSVGLKPGIADAFFAAVREGAAGR